MDIIGKALSRAQGQAFLADFGTVHMHITTSDDGWGVVLPDWHFNLRLYGDDAAAVAKAMESNAVAYGVTIIDPATIKTQANVWA